MLRPSVVRSITVALASALIVSGPSRFELCRIEYWVVRNPAGASKLVVELRDVPRRRTDGETIAVLRPYGCHRPGSSLPRVLIKARIGTLYGA